MRRCTALRLISLLALSSPLLADAVYEALPDLAFSVHDEPIDGAGDTVQGGAAELGKITLSATAEDRAIQEYSLAGFGPADVSASFIGGTIVPLDATDVGPRTFDFYLFPGDGASESGDFESPGIYVGSAQYHPPMDTQLQYYIDVSAHLFTVATSGNSPVALRVKATGNPGAGDWLDTPLCSLQLVLCTGGGSVAYCFGDGTGAPCPCGAYGSPGEGCQNSAGTGSSPQASGNASFANDTFQLHVSGVPGSKPGLVLRGDNQVALPVGDGILCSVGNSQRSHVQITSAGSTDFVDWNGQGFSSVANVGTETNFQFWYRDPAGSCSGQGFNFSNGLSVLFGI